MKTSLQVRCPWALALSLASLLAAANAIGASYADAIQADGPIAYWRFNDATPVALNSGSLGAAANGTYYGDATPGAPAPRSPTFVGFEINNTALQLDGSGDFVGTISGLMNGRTNFTISGWIRRNADQPIRTGLWGQNDLVEFGYIDDNTIQVYTDNGLNLSPNPFPNGKWGHLAIVIAGSPGTLSITVSIYTNGQFAASRLNTLPGNNAFGFNIGGGGVYDMTGNFFNGQIDEVAVFDKALSAEQIASHYYAAIGVPQTGPAFLVTTISNHDDGRCSVPDCTLLEALNAANADPNTNTISFQPGLSGTITNSGLPNGYTIVNPVNVVGPGANVLTISGNNSNRVFHLTGGTVSLSDLTIVNGLANSGGGILVEGGYLAISYCQIVSNAAPATAANGGGILVRGNGILVLNYCSVTHNQAHRSGGGITQSESADVSIYHSTIASNRITGSQFYLPSGAGIDVAGGGLYAINSTIASNSSSWIGGGVSVGGSATAEIGNSIIAGNTAVNQGPDAYGTFISDGYNLIGNTNGSTGFTNTSDQLNVNPLLGSLANYGGPTLTMALRSGSPAIDKGYSPGVFSADQRGFPRPLDDLTITNASGGDGADIGAFEVDSRFRIVDLRRSGSDVALSLMTVLGRNYRAEYTNDLASGTWTPFTNNAPGNGYLLWVTNSGGANQSRRFYRGAILP